MKKENETTQPQINSPLLEDVLELFPNFPKNGEIEYFSENDEEILVGESYTTYGILEVPQSK